MKRREFLGLGVVASGGLVLAGTLTGKTALAADKPAAGTTVSEKDILKEGKPTTIANYCENPEKQPNKYCPTWKNSGNCSTCIFYNKDNSETTIKGKKYARCQLLSDPKKEQFVAPGGYCTTYVKKS
jgi:hypothetical protein